VTPKNIIGTPFGWTNAFDVLALQELVDKLYTVVTTNILSTGVQNFWSQPGDAVSVSALAGGLNLVQSMVKPEVLMLLQTPAEVYNFIAKVEAVMQTLTGVSSINRGDMPSSDMSGAAMAFMASQAITFNGGLQSSANQLLESIGTGMVNILKDFASTPRIAIIAGKQNRPQMKTYMGKELEPINNVVCDATRRALEDPSGQDLDRRQPAEGRDDPDAAGIPDAHQDGANGASDAWAHRRKQPDPRRERANAVRAEARRSSHRQPCAAYPRAQDLAVIHWRASRSQHRDADLGAYRRARANAADDANAGPGIPCRDEAGSSAIASAPLLLPARRGDSQDRGHRRQGLLAGWPRP